MIEVRDLLSNDSRDAIERYCRQSARQIVLENCCVARSLGKHLVFCGMRGDYGEVHLLADGFWKMWETIAIGRHVQPGMKCLEMGDDGSYFPTLLADLVGDAGSVLCHSSTPEDQGNLLWSAEANGFADRVSTATGSVPPGHFDFLRCGLPDLDLTRSRLVGVAFDAAAIEVCQKSLPEVVEWGNERGKKANWVDDDGNLVGMDWNPLAKAHSWCLWLS